MDVTHITSNSLRRILGLTERKDALIQLVGEVENEIARVLTGSTTAPAQSPAKAKAAKKRKPASTTKKSRRTK
jgi:hypothetical protein